MNLAKLFKLLMIAAAVPLLFCTSNVVAEEDEGFHPLKAFMNLLLGTGGTKNRTASEAIVVIGAGYGRTGTRSLKSALNILGLPAYHMDEVTRNKHQQIGAKTFAGDETALKEWFQDMLDKGFKSTVDMPTSLLYKEQMKLFPEAKVVLTMRDEEKWFKSWTNLLLTAGKMNGVPFTWLTDFQDFLGNTIGSKTSPYGVPECIGTSKDMWEFYEPWYFPWISYPVAPRVNKTACLERYRQHVAEVERVVPKEKLIKMYISDGWKPLCDKLGLPVPEVPFPKVNSSVEMAQIKRVLVFVATFYPFILAIGVALLYGIVLVSYKSAQRFELFSSDLEKKKKQ